MSGKDKDHLFISYPIDEFLKYKDINDKIPLNLTLFTTERGAYLTFRDSLIKETTSIIDTFRSGVNPNDIVFLGLVREYLNIISQKNYNEYSEKLRKLNYKNAGHFDTLANELVTRAMIDMIAVKRVDLPAGQKTSSEIYADIAFDFSSFFIKDGDTEIKFVLRLIGLCKTLFGDFVDPTKPLDQNNQYRVDNYRGFLNFLGLLYGRNIILSNTIIDCMKSVKDLIFKTSWGQTECENAYDGYKNLINQVLNALKLKSDKKGLSEKDMIFIELLDEINQDIVILNTANPKLRKFSIMTHTDFVTRLKDLKKEGAKTRSLNSIKS